MLSNNMKSFALIVSLFFSLIGAAIADTADTLLRNIGDPVAGNPKGKITVVEFFDYQCSHCVSMAPAIQSIIKSNPDVRIVFKEFPIRGPMSEVASRAALAANKQGKYYAFNHALLTTPLSLSEGSIDEIAKSVGLDNKKMQKDMNSGAIKKQLQKTSDLARELNINGTPAFFIGKTNAKSINDLNFVLGEMSESDLQDAINKAKS